MSNLCHKICFINIIGFFYFFFIINKYLLKNLFNFKKYERAKKKTFSYELNDFQLMKNNAFVITTETNNYKL